MYYIDPEARQAIREKVGAGIDHVQPDQFPEGVKSDGAEPFIDALWDAWLQTTVTLIAFGFSQRSLCDAAATVATVRDEAGTLVRT